MRRHCKKKMDTKKSSSSNGKKIRIYCLFCYKFSETLGTKDGQSQTDKLNICHRFYKHIGGDEVPFTEKVYGSVCGVCDNCFDMIDNHCQLYYDIECLRLKLKWQVYKLWRVMKYAGKVTSRVKDFEKGLMDQVTMETKDSTFNLEKVLSFRLKLYKKCSQGLKNKNPTVVLSNALIAKGISKGENISVSKDAKRISTKTKVSKATQTISELSEFIQCSSDHENTEISTDVQHDRVLDGNVASNNEKGLEKFSVSKVKPKLNGKPTNKTYEASSNCDNEIIIEGTEQAKGKIDSISPNYKCIICDKAFLSNTLLVEHEREKHWNLITGISNNWSKRTCSDNENPASHHYTSGGAGDNQTYACAICGILYSSLSYLDVHLVTAHNMLISPVSKQINQDAVGEDSSISAKSPDNEKPDNVPGFKDDVVPVQKAPRRAKRFQAECPKCGKIFKCVNKWRVKEKVKRHLQTKMHGGTGKWKVCNTCGRQFKTKHLLKMHKRSPCKTTVSDDDSTSGPGNLLVLREIFKCCHCVKTFSTQEKLESHEGARECFDENDDDENESESSSNDHHTRGTSRNEDRDWSKGKNGKLVKPVFTASCPKCWKVFERCNEKDLQAVLKRHLYESKLHGGRHSWKHLCSVCGVRYQYRSSLESHMKRYHSEKSAEKNSGNDDNSSSIDYLIYSGPMASLKNLSRDVSTPIVVDELEDRIGENFKCAYCDFHTNACDLMDHENTYHSYYVSEEKLKCSRCPQIFDMEMTQNYNSLRTHFLQVHLGIQTSILDDIDRRS